MESRLAVTEGSLAQRAIFRTARGQAVRLVACSGKLDAGTGSQWASFMPPLPNEDAWASNEWDILRAAYLTLFGVPLDAYAVLDPEADVDALGSDTTDIEALNIMEDVCYLLRFQGRDVHGAGRVYATFGAARWTGGAELFLRSAAAYGHFRPCREQLLGRLLHPGDVIPVELPCTELRAVTFLPVDAGSFALPTPDGALTSRRVLQVVPITADEIELARSDFPALVAALRASGSLEAMDPLRPSCVGRTAPGPYWTRARLVLLARTRRTLRHHTEYHRNMAAIGASGAMIADAAALLRETSALLRFLESHAANARHGLSQAVELRRLVIDTVIELYDVVPQWVLDQGESVLHFVFATHPRAMPLVEDALASPARSVVKEPKAFLARMLRVFESVTTLPTENVVLAATRGMNAELQQAKDKGLRVDPGRVWIAVATEMFALLNDQSTPEARRLYAARSAALASISRAFLPDEATESTAEERLLDAGRALVMDMNLGATGRAPAFGGALTGSDAS